MSPTGNCPLTRKAKSLTLNRLINLTPAQLGVLSACALLHSSLCQCKTSTSTTAISRSHADISRDREASHHTRTARPRNMPDRRTPYLARPLQPNPEPGLRRTLFLSTNRDQAGCLIIHLSSFRQLLGSGSGAQRVPDGASKVTIAFKFVPFVLRPDLAYLGFMSKLSSLKCTES